MSLRGQAASGAKWSAGAATIIVVLQFFQIAVLARLLTPEDFGLMAMIMVVLGFAQAFADMGISNAIIHRQDTTRDQLSSLYWLNILAGTSVFCLILVIVPAVASFYEEPRLQGLLGWAALVFLITPLGQQFQYLLQKHLRFATLGVIEVCAAVAGAATGIVSALAGQGVYSLVWALLANAAVKTLMLFHFGGRQWRPKFLFRKEDIKGFLGFGLYQMGERSINYVSSNADQLLVGALLGAQALGYYNIAFNLVMQPVQRLNPILTRVAFPVFAMVQNDDARLKRGYLFVVKVISLSNFPLLFGLAVVAPWLVPVVFGDAWLPAIVLVQILAVVGLLRSIGNPVGALLLAKGRVDLGFKWNAIVLLTRMLGVYVGAVLGGTVGVAIALLALQIVFSACNYAVLIRPLLGKCLRDYVLSLTPSFVLSGVMAVVVALAMSFGGQPTALSLALVISTGVLVFAGSCLVFQRRQIIEISDLILSRS